MITIKELYEKAKANGIISENGYWLKEKPQIVYGLNDFSDEILIQELENRGYQCTVNNKNMENDDIER